MRVEEYVTVLKNKYQMRFVSNSYSDFFWEAVKDMAKDERNHVAEFCRLGLIKKELERYEEIPVKTFEHDGMAVKHFAGLIKSQIVLEQHGFKVTLGK